GIPFTVEGPDGPEHADFHALRHSYLTMGARAGIDLRTLQELAGHSTPVLTARYSHRRLHDLAGAVEQLPALVGSEKNTPAAAAHHLQGTGTGGITDTASSVFPCSLLAVAPDTGGVSLRLVDDEPPEAPLCSDRPNPMRDKGKEAPGDPLIPSEE